LDNVIYYLAYDIRGDSKSIAGINTIRRSDRTIDPDQIAIRIDQSAAGISLVDHRICLDEIFDSIFSFYDIPSSFCTDDSCGDCRSQIERISYSKYPFSYFDLI